MAQIYAAILVGQHKSQIQIIGHLFLPASRKITQKEVDIGLKKWFLVVNPPLLP
jgi:hypothetical protein